MCLFHYLLSSEVHSGTRSFNLDQSLLDETKPRRPACPEWGVPVVNEKWIIRRKYPWKGVLATNQKLQIEKGSKFLEAP